MHADRALQTACALGVAFLVSSVHAQDSAATAAEPSPSTASSPARKPPTLEFPSVDPPPTSRRGDEPKDPPPSTPADVPHQEHAASVSAPSSAAPTAPSAASRRDVALSATAMVALDYADPHIADGHLIGDVDQKGLGLRFDARYQTSSWFGVGVGADYLSSTHQAPSRHVAFPVILCVTPLSLTAFQLGIALGLGPSFSWYQRGDGSTLRAQGTLLELRLEGVVPVSTRASLVVTTGARLYGEGFSNPSTSGYGTSVESPAVAIDAGLGIRGLP